MRLPNIPRRSAFLATMLLATVPSLGAAPALAKGKERNKPHVSTGGAKRLVGSSAQLTGVVQPKGQSTSYYFQWGPTAAYGSQTPTVNVGSGVTKVPVGQTINGLQQRVTYHFRIVGVYTAAGQPQTILGRDRTFALRSVLKFEIPKVAPVPVGGTFILSGVLGGTNNARRPISLQASLFPFTEPFAPIGLGGITDTTGRFAFRVAHLAQTTDFRVVTLDLRPLYSPVVNVQASVRVTLHSRTSKSGLVRLYGTVTPAVVGAPLSIQLRKAITLHRPSKSEATTRFISQTSTVVKRATRSFSRFSVVLKVRQTGRYRAFVKIRPGAYVSGFSPTIVLHAPAGAGKAKH